MFRARDSAGARFPITYADHEHRVCYGGGRTPIVIETTRVLVVERPIEAVSDYLADYANASEWDPTTHGYGRLDSGPLQLGARWRARSNLLRWNIDLEYTLTRWRPHWITLTGRGLATSFDFAFPDLAGSTEIHAALRYQLRGPFIVAWPFPRYIVSDLAEQIVVAINTSLA